MSLLAEQQTSCLHKTQPPTAICYVVTPSKLKHSLLMRRKAPQSQEAKLMKHARLKNCWKITGLTKCYYYLHYYYQLSNSTIHAGVDIFGPDACDSPGLL